MLFLWEGRRRWPEYQRVLIGRSSRSGGWYPSQRKVTRSPLKMVVQGGCRDNVGFSRVAGNVWERGQCGPENQGEVPRVWTQPT